MREIVLDTETTGLDPENGHRIVEIGAVELWNRLPTSNTYHQYLNPKISMPPEAFAIHGLSDEFLGKQPVFDQIADSFISFIGTSKLIIHNAPFDLKFLNAELNQAGRERLNTARILDSLHLARKKFPGSPVSLDALCRRFNIDSSSRKLHGALLDSRLLAEVYLELTGGRQPNLELQTQTQQANTENTKNAGNARGRSAPLPPLLTEREKKLHFAFISQLGKNALWKTTES